MIAGNDNPAPFTWQAFRCRCGVQAWQVSAGPLADPVCLCCAYERQSGGRPQPAAAPIVQEPARRARVRLADSRQLDLFADRERVGNESAGRLKSRARRPERTGAPARKRGLMKNPAAAVTATGRTLTKDRPNMTSMETPRKRGSRSRARNSVDFTRESRT